MRARARATPGQIQFRDFLGFWRWFSMSESSLSLRFERWQYVTAMYVCLTVVVVSYLAFQEGFAPTVSAWLGIVGLVGTLVSSSGAATYAFDDFARAVGLEGGDD